MVSDPRRLLRRGRDLPIVGPAVARGVADYREWRKDPGRRLRRLLAGRRDLTVVQIGASDGRRQDPIRRLLLDHVDWTALLVEPDPPSFAALRSAYPDEARFTLVHAGVTATDGTQPFWTVDPAAHAELTWLPGHVDQLGTFDRDELLTELGRSRAAAVEPWLVATDVPTLTLATLFERHGVEAIDLLIVDTNGHDAVVLGQLDVERHRPEVVLFEHKHLTDAEQAALVGRLSGYDVTDLGDDLLCVRRGRTA